MNDYILSCCSIADLSKEHFEKRNINVIFFHYMLDGVTYHDDLGETRTMKEFYEAMTNGAMTSTSQVSEGIYEEKFEELLKSGKDVLHIALSSGLSGTYQSACIAADIVRKKYPDRKLYVVDALGASSGVGLIMETLADMRDSGATIDEAYDWIEKNKLRMHYWFFSTDLTFYVRGGRVSKTAGLFGGLLGICPLLNCDVNGKLVARSKIRGKNKVISTIVDRMAEHAEDGENYCGKCFISNSACYEDAKAVADLVKARFKKLSGDVVINDIGPTIGSHTGPGTVALFFWGDERVD